MSAKWTEGPWRVDWVTDGPDGPVVGFAVHGANGTKWHSIASLNSYEANNADCYTPEEKVANARLIAEAPAMADALRDIVSLCLRLKGLGYVHKDSGKPIEFSPEGPVAAARALLARLNGEG